MLAPLNRKAPKDDAAGRGGVLEVDEEGSGNPARLRRLPDVIRTRMNTFARSLFAPSRIRLELQFWKAACSSNS